MHIAVWQQLFLNECLAADTRLPLTEKPVSFLRLSLGRVTRF